MQAENRKLSMHHEPLLKRGFLGEDEAPLSLRDAHTTPTPSPGPAAYVPLEPLGVACKKLKLWEKGLNLNF